MALLDYKIVRFSHEGRHVTTDVRVYRGAITTQQELVDGAMQDVTRYRRTAMVLEKHYEYDVPIDMTREEFITKARKYLNNKLIIYANNHGHTVITKEKDVEGLDEVTNESET